MEPLLSEYKGKRKHIKQRLKEFRNIHKGKDGDIFAELCFCILTPQSKAVSCDKVVAELVKSGVLFKGDLRQLRAGLKSVRFPNNKARYIAKARKLFTRGRYLSIKDKIDVNNTPKTREWLVRNVAGLGFKEASHFLRNIGLGEDLAILDVHILRNLKRYKVIKEIPSSMTKKAYLNIENRMKAFSRRINIPLEELDLLFWSSQTGFIFK